MITYKQGNLLDVTEGVIIHGCNAKGVMGSGVALAIKTKYPLAYTSYKEFESLRGLRLAGVNAVTVGKGLAVVNIITQENFGRELGKQYVSYGAIHLGFEKVEQYFMASMPFHFPKIGAGLGGGDWDKISMLIEFACPGRELICWTL